MPGVVEQDVDLRRAQKSPRVARLRERHQQIARRGRHRRGLLRRRSGRITDQLSLSSDTQTWSLIHPHEWRIIADTPSLTTLRYMEQGNLLGQCDIIPLPDRLADQEGNLEQFQRVVETKLAENSATITGSSESTDSATPWTPATWSHVIRS